MRSLLVVMPQILSKPDARIPWRSVIPQIDVFILDCPPEPLNEDVVERPTFAIHTDLYTSFLQQPRVVGSAEMAALIAVPDPWRRVCQCLADRLQDKRQFQRIIQRPTDH